MREDLEEFLKRLYVAPVEGNSGAFTDLCKADYDGLIAGYIADQAFPTNKAMNTIMAAILLAGSTRFRGMIPYTRVDLFDSIINQACVEWTNRLQAPRPTINTKLQAAVRLEERRAIERGEL